LKQWTLEVTFIREVGIVKIGVAETFLNDDVMQAEISIEGYTIYRKDKCWMNKSAKLCYEI
jgi:hypothetical protein